MPCGALGEQLQEPRGICCCPLDNFDYSEQVVSLKYDYEYSEELHQTAHTSMT